jgi:hypothetical protein
MWKGDQSMMAEGQIEEDLGVSTPLFKVWLGKKGLCSTPLQDYRLFYINDVPQMKSVFVESIDRMALMGQGSTSRLKLQQPATPL